MIKLLTIKGDSHKNKNSKNKSSVLKRSFVWSVTFDSPSMNIFVLCFFIYGICWSSFWKGRKFGLNFIGTSLMHKFKLNEKLGYLFHLLVCIFEVDNLLLKLTSNRKCHFLLYCIGRRMCAMVGSIPHLTKATLLKFVKNQLWPDTRYG